MPVNAKVDDLNLVGTFTILIVLLMNITLTIAWTSNLSLLDISILRKKLPIYKLFSHCFPKYRQYPGMYASNLWILAAHKSRPSTDILECWGIVLIIFEISLFKICIFLKALYATEFLQTLRFNINSECYLV